MSIINAYDWIWGLLQRREFVSGTVGQKSMTGEAVSPSGEAMTVLCLMDTMDLSNCTLNTYACAHKLLLLSTLVRKTSFATSSSYRRNSKLVQVMRISDGWMPSPKSVSFPPSLREHWRKSNVLWDTVLRARHGQWQLELTAPVTISSRATQDWVHQHSVLQGVKGIKRPHPSLSLYKQATVSRGAAHKLPTLLYVTPHPHSCK